MKIALLTIWHEKNYGAELQAYATIKAIKHLGHCPEMINIHLASKEQPSFLGRIANFIEKLLPASTKFERFGVITYQKRKNIIVSVNFIMTHHKPIYT